MQVNVSKAGKSLEISIGGFQGRFHVDIHDDPAGYTVFTLFYRFPPGSCPGPFMFPEHGLYSCSMSHVVDDIWVVFIVFKGRHVHGGLGPMVARSVEEIESLNAIPEGATRIGFVSYPNTGATIRSGTCSVFPRERGQDFGTDASLAADSANRLTFLRDGNVVMGGAHHNARWIYREQCHHIYNLLTRLHNVFRRDSDAVPTLEAVFAFVNKFYVDTNGGTDPLEIDPRFNPRKDPAGVRLHRLRYHAMYWLAHLFLPDVTKTHLREEYKKQGGDRLEDELPPVPSVQPVNGSRQIKGIVAVQNGFPVSMQVSSPF